MTMKSMLQFLVVVGYSAVTTAADTTASKITPTAESVKNTTVSSISHSEGSTTPSPETLPDYNETLAVLKSVDEAYAAVHSWIGGKRDPDPFGRDFSSLQERFQENWQISANIGGAIKKIMDILKDAKHPLQKHLQDALPELNLQPFGKKGFELEHDVAKSEVNVKFRMQYEEKLLNLQSLAGNLLTYLGVMDENAINFVQAKCSKSNPQELLDFVQHYLDQENGLEEILNGAEGSYRAYKEISVELISSSLMSIFSQQVCMAMSRKTDEEISQGTEASGKKIETIIRALSDGEHAAKMRKTQQVFTVVKQPKENPLEKLDAYKDFMCDPLVKLCDHTKKIFNIQNFFVNCIRLIEIPVTDNGSRCMAEWGSSVSFSSNLTMHVAQWDPKCFQNVDACVAWMHLVGKSLQENIICANVKSPRDLLEMILSVEGWTKEAEKSPFKETRLSDTIGSLFLMIAECVVSNTFNYEGAFICPKGYPIVCGMRVFMLPRL